MTSEAYLPAVQMDSMQQGVGLLKSGQHKHATVRYIPADAPVPKEQLYRQQKASLDPE